MRQLLLVAAVLSCLGAADAQNALPNPSFEEGADQPTGWTLSAGAGKWDGPGHTGKHCLTITGDGKNANFWSTPMPDLPAMGIYRMSFWARALPGTSGGCFVSGPSFCNRDYGLSDTWRRYSSVLCIPGKTAGGVCRLGQWTVNGSGQFDDVELRPVLPVHAATADGLTLGDGEEIAGTAYSFRTNLGGPGSNYSRCLQSATAGFNSSRWCFGPGNEVVYRLQPGALAQAAASVTVNVGYYSAGTCVIEAAREPGQWQPVGQLNGLGSKTFPLPGALFPTPAVYLRLRSPGAAEKSADFAPGSFQVHGLEYKATLAQDAGRCSGATSFLDVTKSDPRVAVAVQSLGSLLPGDEQAVLAVTSQAGGQLEASLTLRPGQTTRRLAQATAGQEARLTIPYGVAGAGDYQMALRVTLDGVPLWEAGTDFHVPTLYAADYGYAIAARPNMDLWWCESTYKIGLTRTAPTTPAPVRMAAARNEYEPVQVVLRPKTALTGLAATLSDFTGPGGASIPASAFTIRKAEYLKVTIPTDGSSCVGWWPDPLPALRVGADVPDAPLPAGQNVPLWVTVKVPQNARAGLYKGSLTLKAGADTVPVPIQLQVYDFTMPSKSHLTTCWGWSMGNVQRYHNLTNAEDVAKVRDLYLQDFREHRIAPYSFGGNIKVEVQGANWSGGTVVADQAAEGSHSLVVVDDSPKANVAAAPTKMLPVEKGAAYRFSWAVKTDKPGQNYHLTLGCHNASGTWFSGRNIDLIFPGTGEWQRKEITLPADRFPDGCTQLDLSLRGAQWSDKGERTGTTWWDDLYLGKADGGPNLIADPSFEIGSSNVKVVVDWSAFDAEAHKYLDEYGFTGFRLPLQFLGGGRDPSFVKGRIGPFEEGTPEYERLFASYARELQDHLEQKGWLDKAYLYWFDEPEPGDYDFVRRTNERIHRAAPKLNRMLTEQPEPALFGAVDTWCPVTFNYDRTSCQARQKAGEKIWWYVCCGPRAPWPGLFIDHGATELRVWMWQTWQNKVQGCLVWESTWWNSSGSPIKPQNPWTDPMGWTPEGGCWGNGDGRFIYPANRDYPHDKRPYVEGPVDSIRWEMLREGLEDYEYLYLLNQCIQKKLPGAAAYAKLLEVPPTISEDLTHFAREPQPIYAQRAKIAAALEKLKADRLGIK
ncbi:DUF4091 domain-containing protein [bacterium]|nr:DUF4091 domain-containing protein [bacterium]